MSSARARAWARRRTLNERSVSCGGSLRTTRVRHADAGLVAVRLAFGRDCACLVVRDDGRGPGAIPSAAALLANGKLGLVGMEERTRLAGGEFWIRSRPGGGTTVAVQVPLVAVAAA